MNVDLPARVLVVAATPSLAADLAALVRSAGLTVVREAKDLEHGAVGAANVVVIAAGTPVATGGLPDGRGVVIVGIDTALTDRLSERGGSAIGVVHADADPVTVGAAIRAVSVGLSVHPPDLPDGHASRDRRRSTSLPNRVDEDGDTIEDAEPLTAREIDVLDALAQGLPNRAIAARLDISEHTVKFHLASIFGKLGATTRTSAVRRALRRGLIHL